MRLVTRSDFDGLVCGALLAEAGVIDDYLFVHPKDLQDGKVVVSENDVLANVPYVSGCGLWFDHHSSEEERLRLHELKFKGESRKAPSCARVIYDYYGGSLRFAHFNDNGLMTEVDRSDSGNLERKDILTPEGWILLSFIVDPRTGLGRYRDYRISNLELMKEMMQYCREMDAGEILALPDVQERVQRYFEQEKNYEEMILAHSRADGNVLIIDLHEVEEILTGNRFKEYVLFPEQNVSLRIIWGFRKQNMVLTCGHSIVNRGSRTDVGSLMLAHGGGGHRGVGTCQVPVERWEAVRDQLLAAMKADG